MIGEDKERLASLHQAQQEVTQLRLRALFAEYQLSVVLHWNKELHAHELRARSKPGGMLEMHVAKLERFIRLPEQERRERLTKIQSTMYR